MTSTFDFDRLLASVLEHDGPQAAPQVVVDAALSEAEAIHQSRPMIRVLDRRAWPARRASMSDPQTARLLIVGIAMLLILALIGAAIGVGSRLLRFDDARPPVWDATGVMAQARTAFSATLLLDGRVLVAGGGSSDGSGNFDSAELFDPSSESWTATGTMIDGRRFHTATLLLDGRVLVAGGGDRPTSAELFDPRTGTWTSTGEMSAARTQHVAIRLPDGKVLVAGGTSGSDPPTAAELYDPDSGTWTATGDMVDWRASPTAILLPGGQVLVAGGFGSNVEITSAELYDPVAATWTATGDLSGSRVDGTTATLLPDGTVLVIGGPTGEARTFQEGSTAELYDPATGRWRPTAPTSQGQGGHTATLLPDGRVLVAAGIDPDGAPLASTRFYDPGTSSWSEGAALVEARVSGQAILLLDGRVLVMGGIGRADTAISSAELLEPPAGD